MERFFVVMDCWILLSLSTGAIAIYYYCFKNMNFFKKHGIIHVPPLPFFGNMAPVFIRQSPLPYVIKKTYDLKPDAKYVGFFDLMNPVVVIRDPELIKSIAIKNFEQFPDHRGFIDEANDPLVGKNLFSLRGDKWRDVRTLLSPAFTSIKMKAMFKLMSDCTANFTDYLSKIAPDKDNIELKTTFTRYTTDVIASCAFGINVDSMRNPDNEFYIYGKEVTNYNIKFLIKFYLGRSMPVIARTLGIKVINDRTSQFFKNIVRITIQTRDMQNIVRPDMLQLMMDSRGKRGDNELTIEDMTSQAFIFFLGGFDTTSILMSFAAHEIAVNPSVQQRLRDEIDEVLTRTNGALNYEAINGMQYLDAVVNESLRLYPVSFLVDRICAKDFELPPALPGHKPFVVRKGMYIWFFVYGIHRDPQYFDKPDEFYPERFLGEKKKEINAAAYIPFGLGPRMCLGNRFALLEVKVLLFYILARCELKRCAKTTYPMRFARGSFPMQPEGGFWLKIQPRSNVHPSLSSSVVDSSTTVGKI